MTLSTVKKIITTRRMSNISRSKDNKTMKFVFHFGNEDLFEK